MNNPAKTLDLVTTRGCGKLDVPSWLKYSQCRGVSHLLGTFSDRTAFGRCCFYFECALPLVGRSGGVLSIASSLDSWNEQRSEQWRRKSESIACAGTNLSLAWAISEGPRPSRITPGRAVALYVRAGGVL